MTSPTQQSPGWWPRVPVENGVPRLIAVRRCVEAEPLSGVVFSPRGNVQPGPANGGRYISNTAIPLPWSREAIIQKGLLAKIVARVRCRGRMTAGR